MRVGFIGLGHMGGPMATRLLNDRHSLVVWNRSPAAAQRLHNQGAVIAETPRDLFDKCDLVIVMLADLAAINDVLGSADTAEGPSIDGRVVVNMGTIAPADSSNLGQALAGRGAEYVEAPVSGSRVQAENGALVGMLAGRPALLDDVEPVLAPLCQSTIRCGEVPQALLTKLAVNTFLITMVTGLAEAVLLAQANGVDHNVLQGVLDAGPMASDVSRIKIAKLLADDYTPQATVRGVRYNTQLILDQASRAGIALPLLTECEKLLTASHHRGDDDLDMVAVLGAMRASAPRGEPEPPPETE